MIGIIAFIITVVFAVTMKWEAKDLIWGLWVSSFCVGYAYIVRIIIIGIVQGAKTMPMVGAIIAGMLFLVFFTIHFGFFHVVHSVFLSIFFPLIPMDRSNFPNVSAYLSICISSYWPVILGTFLVRVPDLFIRPIKKAIDMRDQMGLPYANVVKIHLLIFVFAGMSALHLSRFAMYPILLFFFFPWEIFKFNKEMDPSAA